MTAETCAIGGLINPDAFPVPDFNTDVLDYQAGRLRSLGADLARVGGDIKSSWAGLSSCYSAPEAEELFAAVDPVAVDGETIAAGTDQAATALETFAQDVRDLKVEWSALRSDANRFLESIEGDEDWREGGFFDEVSDKVAEHNELIGRANLLVQDYQAAEMKCANAVTAGLPGRTTFRFADSYTDSAGVGEMLYGYGGNPRGMDTAWGGPLETDHHWAMDVDHAIGDFLETGGEDLSALFGVDTTGGRPDFSWDTLREAHWGNLTGTASLFGVYDPEDGGWGWPDKDVAIDAWAGVAHSIVPWTEWDERPGYVVGTTAITIIGGGGAFAALKVLRKGDADTPGGTDVGLRIDIPFLGNVGSSLPVLHLDLPTLERFLDGSALSGAQDALDRLISRNEEAAHSDPATQDLDDALTVEDVLNPASEENTRLRDEYEGDFLENDVRSDGEVPDSWEASNTGLGDDTDSTQVPALVGPRSDTGEGEGVPDTPSSDRPVDLTGIGDHDLPESTGDGVDLGDRTPDVTDSVDAGSPHGTPSHGDGTGDHHDVGPGGDTPDYWDELGGGAPDYDAELGGDGPDYDAELGGDGPLSETPSGDMAPAERVRVAEARISEGAETFASDRTAIEYGNSHWNEYVNGLSEDHQRALSGYSASPPHSPNYTDYNDYLRSPYDDPPAWLEGDLRLIDEALGGRPLPNDVVVSRGTGLGHLGVDPWELTGGNFTYTNKGYLSTSLGSVPGLYQSKEAVLHLRVPAGTPALWMPEVSRSGAAERELLLGRGIEYRIVDAILDENGQWQIYAEVVR
ncbi:ADP-ribosyltransferase [Nocardiopsis sp. NPDC050513]|uniref:ADP-ribosyltransferase n=1 Tax=Nocardiopsis sp. NPDC050513 TaxID=3364338 RepID=UPI0037BD79B2